MRIDLLAKILQDAGLGTMGQDIFIHRMNSEVHQGIMLKLPIAGIPTMPELPGYFKCDFQIIVRAVDQATGDQLAANAAKALTFYERDLTNDDGSFAMQVKQIYPIKLPIVFPRSTGHGTEWSVNMHIAYVLPL